VQIARKTARCVIYQFPHSTILSGTARPLVSNLEFRIYNLAIFSSSKNHQNGIHMDTHIRESSENSHDKNFRTPANIRINLHRQKLDSMLNIFVDSMGLPLLFLTQKIPQKF